MRIADLNWRKVVSAWGPMVLCMVAIYWLSAQSSLPRDPILGDADKLHNTFAYIALAWAALRGARTAPLFRWNPYYQSFVLAALFGASDEYHQSFVPGRQMDIMDWLADLAGILVALALSWLYYQRTKGGR